MVRDLALTGAAGEYYVAFRLLTMNFTVALTPRGTTSIDMIVANRETGKSITIQTKTGKDAFVKRASQWNWRVGKKLRKPFTSFFYVFVDLKNDPSKTPDVFIIPSKNMRPHLRVYPGGAELDSPEVTDIWFGIDEEGAPKYRNKWELIEGALV